MTPRKTTYRRSTKETAIELEICLDGTGTTDISTGLPFFDHMLDALSRHSAIDLRLRVQGDLAVDDHHTIEDTALALGSAIDQLLASRAGLLRFGYAYAPLDESLARAVIDLSGRPAPVVNLQLNREQLGGVSCENLTHFFRSFALSLKASLHIDVLRGENDHHKAEAAFKALALALRQALSRDSTTTIRSTKGTLTAD